MAWRIDLETSDKELQDTTQSYQEFGNLTRNNQLTNVMEDRLSKAGLFPWEWKKRQ